MPKVPSSSRNAAISFWNWSRLGTVISAWTSLRLLMLCAGLESRSPRFTAWSRTSLKVSNSCAKLDGERFLARLLSQLSQCWRVTLRMDTPLKNGFSPLMQIIRRWIVARLRAWRTPLNQTLATSANVEFFASDSVKAPICRRRSAKRRAAKARSEVLRLRRNCLPPLLSSA